MTNEEQEVIDIILKVVAITSIKLREANKNYERFRSANYYLKAKELELQLDEQIERYRIQNNQITSRIQTKHNYETNIE